MADEVDFFRRQHRRRHVDADDDGEQRELERLRTESVTVSLLSDDDDDDEKTRSRIARWPHVVDVDNDTSSSDLHQDGLSREYAAPPSPRRRRRRRSPSLTPPPGAPLRTADRFKLDSSPTNEAPAPAPAGRSARAAAGGSPTPEKSVTLTLQLSAHVETELPHGPPVTVAMAQTARMETALTTYMDRCRVPARQRHGLFLVYNNLKVFTSATPAILGIDDAAAFEVHTQQSYDMLQEQRHARQKELLAHLERQRAEANAVAEETASSPVAEQIGDDDAEYIKIRVRNRDMDDFVVEVKFTTVFSRIYAAVRDNCELARSGTAQLIFEGECIPPHATVEELELEDGDMIELRVV